LWRIIDASAFSAFCGADFSLFKFFPENLGFGNGNFVSVGYWSARY
jgi:hypothetical protein